jgi:phage-related holin
MLISLKAMFTKTSGLILAIPTVAISTSIDPQKGILFLCVLFVIDFATGIAGSYVEWRKTDQLIRLISSEKLRMSAVKLFTYFSGIIVVYGVEMIFFEKRFKFQSITDKDFTITSIAIAFFCAIEIYSIVFENFKKMGFDVLANIKKLVTVFKDTKKAIE